MQLFKTKPTIGQLQWMGWTFVFLVLMLSLLAMDSLMQATVYSLLNTAFYAAIVYGNILWLFPKLYLRGKIVGYVLAVILFLLFIGAVRAFIMLNIYNLLFAKHPEPLTIKAIISMIIGSVTIFMLSFIFRIALAYFTLKQQSEEILAQKTQAELNLLKSQVQPHFLFNTLNNIYYEAYLEAPRTAALIERLSDIMRYFVDESPKQMVSLATEISFLENYIALEKIRIRYEISVKFTKDCDTSLSIPPMLFITFVENIFKHGIDKTSNDNLIELSFSQVNNMLTFMAINTIPAQPQAIRSTGFGLANLHERLRLLYGADHQMRTHTNGQTYTAILTIPVI